MKTYCVLLSFTFANILVETVDHYKEEVYITNELLQKACEIGERFEDVIRNILHKCHEEGPYLLEDIVYMLAVPEHANTKGPNINNTIKYQTDLQKTIIEVLNYLEVPDAKSFVNEIEDTDLDYEGFQRRFITRFHLKCLVESVERGQESFSPIQICYLIVLYKNSYLPLYESERYTKNATVDDNGRCTLTSSEGDVSYYDQNTQNYNKQVVITNKLLQKAAEVGAKFLYVIRKIIHEVHEEGSYLLEDMVYMLVVPEHANTEGPNINKAIKYQTDLQKTIIEVLNFLEVPDAESLGNEFRVTDLEREGYERRLITKYHLKCLLERVERDQESFSSIQICSLIGLYKNALLPLYQSEGFIKTATVNNVDRCTLTSAQDDVSYYEQHFFKIKRVWPGTSESCLFLKMDE